MKHLGNPGSAAKRINTHLHTTLVQQLNISLAPPRGWRLHWTDQYTSPYIACTSVWHLRTIPSHSSFLKISHFIRWIGHKKKREVGVSRFSRKGVKFASDNNFEHIFCTKHRQCWRIKNTMPFIAIKKLPVFVSKRVAGGKIRVFYTLWYKT